MKSSFIIQRSKWLLAAIKNGQTNRPRLFYKLFIALLVLAQTGLGTARAVIYDLSADYSLASNPNGVWSYGAMTDLSGPFTPFTTTVSTVVDYWAFGYYDPSIWRNDSSSTITIYDGQGVFPPGTVALFPGDNGIPYGLGVARFTAPQAGDYQLQTAVQSYLNGSLAGDYDFHVLDDGVQVFGQFLPGSSGTSFATTLTLAAGDTIDFAVGRGLDGNADYSAALIQATLIPVPEPATFVLVGLGSAVMLIRRK